jgi:hypothetical protein
MTLSELFELSPLAWEQARWLTIIEHNYEFWDRAIEHDYCISDCFNFIMSGNYRMWEQLEHYNDTTLLKQWEAKQISK